MSSSLRGEPLHERELRPGFDCCHHDSVTNLPAPRARAGRPYNVRPMHADCRRATRAPSRLAQLLAANQAHRLRLDVEDDHDLTGFDLPRHLIVLLLERVLLHAVV